LKKKRIAKNRPYYNLDGEREDNPSGGVYISGGRKTTIKTGTKVIVKKDSSSYDDVFSVPLEK